MSLQANSLPCFSVKLNLKQASHDTEGHVRFSKNGKYLESQIFCHSYPWHRHKAYLKSPSKREVLDKHCIYR